MAADLLAADGKPLYQWRDVRVDPHDYTVVIFEAVRERKRWRTEYERTRGRPVDNVSATRRAPALRRADRKSPTLPASPYNCADWSVGWLSGVSAANREATPVGARDGRSTD